MGLSGKSGRERSLRLERIFDDLEVPPPRALRDRRRARALRAEREPRRVRRWWATTGSCRCSSVQVAGGLHRPIPEDPTGSGDGLKGAPGPLRVPGAPQGLIPPCRESSGSLHHCTHCTVNVSCARPVQKLQREFEHEGRPFSTDPTDKVSSLQLGVATPSPSSPPTPKQFE